MGNKLRVVIMLAALFVAATMVGIRTLAQRAGPVAYASAVVQAGQPEVKQLLFLMDTDKDGKISKAEFMNFMASEFDNLDTNHDGVLDVRELTRPQARLQWVGK
jgi:hypothetical protein